MYTLLRITEDKYRMVENKGSTIIEGNWEMVKGYCEYQGFRDLDLARQIMEENIHNAADFGIGKAFIFSFDNKHIPNLRIVS